MSIFCGFLELNCDTVKSSSWFLHLNCRIGNIAAHKAIYMRISLFMIQRQINSQLNYCQEGYFVIAMIVYDAYISSGMNIYWMAFTDTPYDEYMYIHRQARAFIVLYILYYKIHIKIEFTIQKTFHFFFNGCNLNMVGWPYSETDHGFFIILQCYALIKSLFTN